MLTRIEKIIVIVLAVACAIVVALVTLSCTPHVARVATPISSSHSQLTATDYDLAEAAFGGGLAPIPEELVGWTQRECQSLLNKRNLARAFKLGLVGLTGGSGVTTLIPKDADEDEQKAWDIALGGLTLTSATAATILGALEISWSNTYEQECNTEKPAPPEHPASDEVETDGGVE
jgi:hypothetical protein